MSIRALAYLLFTLALSAIFAGIVLYTYARKRRDRVEAPKYRMLCDDPEPPSPEERG
ncbi:MAG: hypothetical protein Kow00128_02580 [Deltaproteobacteria bacterium]